MFTAPLEKILAALEEMKVYRTIDVWDGDVADLMNKVQQFPSAHVLLSVGEFDPTTTIGGATCPQELTWSIVVMVENRATRAAGARQALTILEQMLNPATPPSPESPPGLVRLNTGAGLLWPAVLQFLGSEGGKVMYGFKFNHEKGRNSR
jgi:hypothetical protein